MTLHRRSWEQYRISNKALEVAAARAAAGQVLAAGPPDGAAAGFDGVVSLARAAQNHWWHSLLGRLDATLDDDLAAMSRVERETVVRAAWSAQRLAMPGYLALAELGAADIDHQNDRRRYARLVALFAGRADIDDDVEDAAVAGLELVAELLNEPGPPLSSDLFNYFAMV